MVSRHRKHAPRHPATASYPCSLWFERRWASSWQPRPLPTRFPVLTFDRFCSSLFSLVLLSQSVAAFAERNHIFEKTHLFSMRRG
jgi:hypothetical protein